MKQARGHQNKHAAKATAALQSLCAEVGMNWWNGLSQRERETALEAASKHLGREASPGEAWDLWRSNQIGLQQLAPEPVISGEILPRKELVHAPHNAPMEVYLQDIAGHFDARQRRNLALKFSRWAVQLLHSVDLMEGWIDDLRDNDPRN